jgi:hypothetical protein
MRNEMTETPTLNDLIDYAMKRYGYDLNSAYAYVAGSLFAVVSDENKQLVARALGK